ncbi:hypothetical protein [Nocardia sp. CA-290969]|uniref:hypothetical protein n=1 Tax=Nocardia sp. CA-290969 TaxID=3239986 RepID=UPI003D89B258
MNAEQIRAEAIEALARSRYERVRLASNSRSMPPWDDEPGEPYDIGGVTAVQVGSFDPRRRYRVQAAFEVDALAAAGLLPTIVEEVETGVWGVDKPVRRRVRYLTEWREVSE